MGSPLRHGLTSPAALYRLQQQQQLLRAGSQAAQHGSPGGVGCTREGSPSPQQQGHHHQQQQQQQQHQRHRRQSSVGEAVAQAVAEYDGSMSPRRLARISEFVSGLVSLDHSSDAQQLAAVAAAAAGDDAAGAQGGAAAAALSRGRQQAGLQAAEAEADHHHVAELTFSEAAFLPGGGGLQLLSESLATHQQQHQQQHQQHQQHQQQQHAAGAHGSLCAAGSCSQLMHSRVTLHSRDSRGSIPVEHSWASLAHHRCSQDSAQLAVMQSHDALLAPAAAAPAAAAAGVGAAPATGRAWQQSSAAADPAAAAAAAGGVGGYRSSLDLLAGLAALGMASALNSVDSTAGSRALGLPGRSASQGGSASLESEAAAAAAAAIVSAAVQAAASGGGHGGGGALLPQPAQSMDLARRLVASVEQLVRSLDLNEAQVGVPCVETCSAVVH
jgi:hypothetical protein